MSNFELSEKALKEAFASLYKKIETSPELPSPKILCNKAMLEGFRERGLTEEQLKELIVNYEDLIEE
jgi:hypothetical protein